MLFCEAAEEVDDEEPELSDEGTVAHQASQGSSAPDRQVQGALEPNPDEELEEFELSNYLKEYAGGVIEDT